MPFGNVGALADAFDAGQAHTAFLRKVPSQATVARWWADLSMAAGNPVPNYYASSPLAAATLDPFRGIFHGDAKAPATKHLHGWDLTTPTAGLVGQYRLLDYLLYYPFVDLDDGDAQVMDNTVALPRYSDGDGVMAMLVAVAPTTGGGSFTFDYINSQGVARTSPVISCSVASAGISSIVTSQPASVAAIGPFLPLASGDTGVRRITGWQNLVVNGGLAALVLVKPLAQHTVFEINTTSEKTYGTDDRWGPQVVDGAYLNMIVNCAASIAAGTLAGRLTFAWN